MVNPLRLTVRIWFRAFAHPPKFALLSLRKLQMPADCCKIWVNRNIVKGNKNGQRIFDGLRSKRKR